jgi:hypothetical protein
MSGDNWGQIRGQIGDTGDNDPIPTGDTGDKPSRRVVPVPGGKLSPAEHADADGSLTDRTAPQTLPYADTPAPTGGHP